MDRGHYLNTDLELRSASELTTLADYLEANGWSVHHSDWMSEGCWLSSFEHPEGHRKDPEHAIRSMLAIIENLPGPILDVWTGCSVREFNIGYQSGMGPARVENSISTETLGRIAALGGSVGITIYPYEAELERVKGIEPSS